MQRLGTLVDAEVTLSLPEVSPTARREINATITPGGWPLKKQITRVSYSEVVVDTAKDPAPAYLSPNQCSKIARTFTLKAQKRLQMFVSECKRSKKKMEEVLQEVSASGYTIKNFELSDSLTPLHLRNKRKRLKNVQFNITATRESMTLTGYLLIKPCSVNLMLASTSIAYKEPVVYCKYYRNLVFRDNYLPALVKGISIENYRKINEVHF